MVRADATQQQLLLELTELDAELIRLDHRATHLSERAEHERILAEHAGAGDRLASVRIALEDLDAQASRVESEIDAVRQREDRDRELLRSVGSAKQAADLQHELETLQRRQSSLEDSLLEVLEQREQLQARQVSETTAIDGLQTDLSRAEQALGEVLAEVDTARDRHSARRAEVTAELHPDLLALYERQRTGHGIGAGLLRGHQCGACRIEIDRGELARFSAAAPDEVLRCPECGAILLRDSNR